MSMPAAGETMALSLAELPANTGTRKKLPPTTQLPVVEIAAVLKVMLSELLTVCMVRLPLTR
jgi:hypothetical protein